MLDLTVYRRQETWEDSPTGWPQGDIMDTPRTSGCPTSQWSRLKAGHSDDLDTTPARGSQVGFPPTIGWSLLGRLSLLILRTNHTFRLCP
jgi:hypothetical protein